MKLLVIIISILVILFIVGFYVFYRFTTIVNPGRYKIFSEGRNEKLYLGYDNPGNGPILSYKTDSEKALIFQINRNGGIFEESGIYIYYLDNNKIYRSSNIINESFFYDPTTFRIITKDKTKYLRYDEIQNNFIMTNNNTVFGTRFRIEQI